MPPLSRLLAPGLSLTLVLVTASSASAHPLVEEGIALVERARFEEALERLERAARGDDLTLADLIRLLEARALAESAMGRDEAMSRDLSRLAALSPDHVFAANVPPEIVWRFGVLRDRAGSRLRVRVAIEPGPDTTVVRATVIGDPGGLVTEVRVAAGVAGGELAREDDGAIEIASTREVALAYYVTVIGIGGATLLEEGSAESPLPAVALPGPPADCPVCPPLAASSIDPVPWIVAGAIAAASIVVAVLVSVLATQESSLTQPSPPMRVGLALPMP